MMNSADLIGFHTTRDTYDAIWYDQYFGMGNFKTLAEFKHADAEGGITTLFTVLRNWTFI